MHTLIIYFTRELIKVVENLANFLSRFSYQIENTTSYTDKTKHALYIQLTNIYLMNFPNELAKS